LAQNHKEAAERKSLDAKSFLNCKQTSKIILKVNQKIAPKNTHVEGKLRLMDA
jgi:sulfur carrier protein ThiS